MLGAHPFPRRQFPLQTQAGLRRTLRAQREPPEPAPVGTVVSGGTTVGPSIQLLDAQTPNPRTDTGDPSVLFIVDLGRPCFVMMMLQGRNLRICEYGIET